MEGEKLRFQVDIINQVFVIISADSVRTENGNVSQIKNTKIMIFNAILALSKIENRRPRLRAKLYGM